MAEGMAGIGLLARHLESDQGDDGGAGIRQVVEGVGRDGDGIADGPRQEFPGEEAQVQENPHSPAEDSVSLPDRRILRVVLFLDEKSG